MQAKTETNTDGYPVKLSSVNIIVDYIYYMGCGLSWESKFQSGGSSASDTHLISSARDEAKQEKHIRYFFPNKNVCFVSPVPKVVLQKKQTLKWTNAWLRGFCQHEGMGGQTQKTRNALYFQPSTLLCLTCTAQWRSRRSKLAPKLVKCLKSRSQKWFQTCNRFLDHIFGRFTHNSPCQE